MSSGYTPKRSQKSGKDKGTDLRPSWMWLAVPLLIIGAVIGVWWGIGSSPSTPEVAASTATPTRIMRPVATATPTAVVLVRTPTKAPSPTLTPTVLARIAPGAKVKVVGTEGAGLNMRVAAGTNEDLVKTVSDGDVLTILAGPKEADGYDWWQASTDSGDVGWVADKWLELYLP